MNYYISALLNQNKWLFIPLSGLYLGHLLEKYYDSHMVLFRDKSALYGKPMKEGQPPSWE